MSHATDCELCCINNLVNQYLESESLFILSILEIYFEQHYIDIDKYIISVYEV